MSFRSPQPGDSDPQDAPRPGERELLRGQGGPNDREGDRAPEDHATVQDEQKLARQTAEAGQPIGGVNFSAPFINRPVATFLLSVAIIIAGCVAYNLLPVSSLPQIEYPVISVGASLPGADPNTMASAVATPLERQFSRIAGVNQMTSSSSTGATSITMQFDLTKDVNEAARDVQAAINAARAQLPANLPSNPTYRKINPSDSPILILALTSKTATIPQMYDASDSILAQKIAQVQGVGQTFTGGSAKPAVRIEADPNLLTHFGLGLEDLRSAIGTINVQEPTGYTNGPQQRTSISTTDQLFGAAAYAPLIIATNQGPVSIAAASTGLPSSSASAVSSSSTTNSTTAAANSSASTGTSGVDNYTHANTNPAASSTFGSTVASNAAAGVGPNTAAASTATGTSNFATSTITTYGPANEHGIVRIQDVASVENSVEDIHTGGYLNGEPAILIIVFKAPGANVISTVDDVLKILPTLQASISPAIKLHVVLDRTLTIRQSVKDIERTLLITILLVVLVVFVFLREVRSTLIPSVSVPLSLLGTFGVMYLLGYTLDNLSLMALTISTGFVVDDAIVVIENISRHLEDGLSPYDAAMLGAREIGFTVLSMSTSLVAVFIPILLMGGFLGRLFREFAVTLSVAIGVSLVVSLTTTPMLSAKFLKPHDQVHKGWFYRMGERHLNRITSEYERGLRWVLRHQAITLLIFFGTLVLNVYLFIVVPKGLFPQQDTGRLSGQIRAQQDSSFFLLKSKVQELMKIVQNDPAVEDVASFIGGGGPGGGSSNQASMFVVLKSQDTSDKNERRSMADSADVVVNRIRPKTARFPGVQLLMQASQELSTGGRSSAAQYQYTLTADNVDDLNTWSPRLMAALAKSPVLKDLNTDQQDQGLESDLVIDRDTASRLGVTPLAIDATLSDAFGQRQVSTTYGPLNQYHVVMEVAQQWQQDPSQLEKIYVQATNGSQVPLSAVTHLQTRRVPLTVNHQSLSPAATLSFNLTPGASLSEATTAVDNARAEIGMPSTIHGGFQGTAQQYQQSIQTTIPLLFLALFSVYIILGILYESFIHPLTILSTLPSAGVGAVLALLIFKIELSVIAMIGVLLLIGIVKKNAIMMIDFALVAEREHGKSPEDAIFEACQLRFRPIMMTTMAALLGALPLALGTGVGAELRRPLGVTIVGGLIVSQCLTLFTTPVVYLYFDRLPRFIRRATGYILEPFGYHPRPAAAPAAHAAGD